MPATYIEFPDQSNNWKITMRIWKNYLLHTLSILFLVICSSAYAIKIDKLVIFGDSLSDDGNLYLFSPESFPPSPPYFLGRFSNGPVWVENLAGLLHLNVEPHQSLDDCATKQQFANCAYGGASVKPYPPIPDLTLQVNNYIAQTKLDDHKDQHLFILWGGGNDYFLRKDNDTVVTETINTIQNQIESLITYGAKYLLIINLPDLGLTPLAKALGHEAADQLTQISKSHNERLLALVDQEQATNPDRKLILIDAFSYMAEMMTHPEQYHFKNVTDSCYDFRKTCKEADEYLFWDFLHPTRYAHQLIATHVFELLREEGLE